MESLTGVLTALGAGFALVAIIAVAFVWARGSADKATIESLERNNAALEEELRTTNRRCDALNDRVKNLEDENSHLKDAVAQVAGIGHLQATADAIRADTNAIRTKVLA
jgi:cell division protein FtsB